MLKFRDGAGALGHICAAPCAAATPAEIVVPLDGGLAGGSRAAWVDAPVRRPLPWTSAMDRHQVAVGAIDPDHDDGYEYRLPYDDASSYPVIQGYGARLSHRGAEQFTVDADGRTQSVAVRFLTREGPIGEPRTGARYLNSPASNPPDG